MSGADETWWEGLEARVEGRLRALGTREPRCSHPGCVETNPFALTGVHPNELCYEHLAAERGRGLTEDHHLAGRSNDPNTASIPANDHRVLSAYQQLWPEETLRNADGSPLLWAAAVIRGWLDVLSLIVERTVGLVPPLLEALNSLLIEQIGPRWWDGFGWEMP